MNSNTIEINIKVDGATGSAAIKRFGSDVEATGRRVNTAMDSMTSSAKRYLATYVSFQGVKALVNIADQYTLIDSKIKLVTKGTDEFARVYQGLFAISQNTGSSFASNASNFSNLSLALKDTKIESSETLKIFDLVNKSLVVAGASTEEASSFMLQFRQAMGSGRLQGEEFRAMMESNSYFGGLLAKTLDTDVAGLREMSKEGKLTTDILRKAFPEMAQQIDRDFNQISKTISRSMVELSNAFNDVLADANKAEGGTNKIATSISEIANTITENKDTISDVFSGIIQAAEVTVKGIGNVARSIQGLAIVAASKDKSITDWIMGDADTMKAWQKEIDNGTAMLKDRLVEVREKITDTQNAWGIWTDKKGQLEALRTEEEKLINQIDARGKIEATVAKTTVDAGNGIIEQHKKIVVSAEEKTKKVIKLETDERWQVLEMQKKAIHEALDEEEKVYKEKQQMLDQQLAESDTAYNSMLSLIKSSKKTEIEVWQDAIDTELAEFERLSDGTQKYTDAMTEYRAIKQKELMERITREEKKNLTEMQKLWQDFGRDVERDFADTVYDGLKGDFDSIGEAFDSLLDRMLDSFLRLISDMVAQNFFSAIFGGSTTGAGGSIGSSIGTGILGWVIDGIFGSGGSYTDGTGAGLGNMYGDEVGTGSSVGGGSSSGGAGGVIGGLATTAATSYIKDYIWTNTLKPAVTAAYDSLAGQFGTTVGTAAADAMVTTWAGNAAADAAGTYAASATAAEFGTAAGATTGAATTTAAAGEGAGMFGGMAASSGPAAIIAMLAVWAGMDIADSGKNKLRDKLNESRVTPTGLGMVGGIEADGQLTRISEEMSDALSLLNRNFGEFEAASIDAASGVAVFANNIVGEGGLITGVNYGIETFDNASGAWVRSQISFQALMDKMEAHIDVTGESVTATARFVAAEAGIPSVADELVAAFNELQTGIFGVAGAAIDGAGAFANAMAMMGSTGHSGLSWYGAPSWDDQSNPSIPGSSAWVQAGGYSQTSSGDQGYNTDTYQLPETFGMADGGVVDRLLVPRGDDGFAALSYGEGVVDKDTMVRLSAALRKGDLSGGGSKEIAELKEVLISLGMTITGHLRRSEKLLEGWEKIGMPGARV